MAAQMSGTVRISEGSETELLKAVAYVGPVSVAVDANSNDFRVNIMPILLSLYHPLTLSPPPPSSFLPLSSSLHYTLSSTPLVCMT